MSKKISVIMGIYNCSKTLNEAVECILNQTYTNWELIMCDDGSSDDTYSKAKKIKETYPEKIKLIKNEKNMGLNFTLNHCLEHASGEYIARMDADDLCSADRFEKEVSFLDNNPDFAIVSTDMEYFDESGTWGRCDSIEFPKNEDFIAGTPFCHAPCMVRKEAYDAVEGYSVDKKLLRVEDYHLWIKIYAKGFKGANLKEPLYMMRDDRNATSRRKFKYRLNEAYVKYLAINMLNLPKRNYIYMLRPIIVGMLPTFLYEYLHKKNLESK